MCAGSRIEISKLQGHAEFTRGQLRTKHDGRDEGLTVIDLVPLDAGAEAARAVIVIDVLRAVATAALAFDAGAGAITVD
jgi:hypothetical protein